jgi:phosphoribosylformylglycinamidine synthase
MHFLHEGRPPVVREAVFQPQISRPLTQPRRPFDYTDSLLKILGSPNVASKEWIIRQYDHEVQAGSVIKPLVGVSNDGPSDAAVVRPVLASQRGIVIACGMNPRYGDFDTQRMAASAIDEAVRNCVAVGADPTRIAILDNFCWGYTDRPETLGSLVRAAVACHDVAVALGTPFISGKDSLNNEFSYEVNGDRRTIAIPPSLLISAIGQVDDVRQCVTMDLKEPGNLLYQVGITYHEMGGSHFALVNSLEGGEAPQLDTQRAKAIFAGLHQAIKNGTVRACHDLSEGGLAVALAEMALAGGYGVRVDMDRAPQQLPSVTDPTVRTMALLFAESNSRFVCEVPRAKQAEFEQALAGVPLAQIGEVISEPRVTVSTQGTTLIDVESARLKESWQRTLKL